MHALCSKDHIQGCIDKGDDIATAAIEGGAFTNSFLQMHPFSGR